MKILIYILLLFSIPAAGQVTIFKMSKFARIKFSHSLPLPPADTEDPTTPTLSFVSKTATTISVSWTTSTDNVGVTGYDIYLDAVLYDNEVGTSTVVSGLTQNTEYDIYVVAKDAAGNESTNSNTITQTTDDTQAPTAPTLAFVSKTTTSISVSWSGATDNVAVTSYDVYKDGVFLANDAGTSYTLTGLNSSTEYDVNVRARDAAANISGNSNTITQTTDAATAYAECTDPNGIDWLNLPLYNGVGYGEIANSSTTETISNVTFTVNTGSVTGNGGGGFGGGNGVKAYNSSNKTFEYCLFKDIYNLGAYFFNCSNITIRNSVFVNCSWGTMFEQCGNNMKAYNNVFIGMYGQKVTLGQGPYRGQAIYMVGTVGSGIEIYGNVVLGPIGETFSEDIISTHTSAGTSGSYISIHDNVIWGGGPGTNGVGIIAGDGTSQYVRIYKNKVGMPAIFGIGVAGGSNIIVDSNMVFSDRTIWSGGPYYAYANPAACSFVTYNDNTNWLWGKHNIFNDNYFPGSCTSSSIESPTVPANRTAAYDAFVSGLDVSDFPNSIVSGLICPDVMWQLRSTKYRSADIVAHGNRTGNGGDAPQKVDLTRPTAVATCSSCIAGGSSASSITLDATSSTATQPPAGLSGTNTISGYRWVQVSGPNQATIVSATSAITSVTGLVDGDYEFRLEVTQSLQYNNGLITAGTADISYFSHHSNNVTITINLP